MIAAVLALLGIGETYVEGKQKIALREAEAVADARIARISNAANWETVVAQRSSRFLRWACAIHLFIGLDFTIYLAVTGADDPAIIFTAFEVMPEWFAGLLATMFAWAFGSEPLKSVGGKLVQTWGNRSSKTKQPS